MTWSTMDKATRIAEIIRSHNKTEGSAANIAADLSRRLGETVTRSAVIGFYNRNKDTLRATFPLTVQQIAVATYRAAKARAPRPARPPRPLPPPVVVSPLIMVPESKGKNLWEVEARECKWPTGRSNGHHLFCAEATGLGENYCQYHAKKSVTAAGEKRKAAAKVPALLYR